MPNRPSFSFYSPAEDRTLVAHGVRQWFARPESGRFLVGAIPFDKSQPAALFEPEEWEFIPGRVDLADSSNPEAIEDDTFTQAQWDSFESRVTEAVNYLRDNSNPLQKIVLARLASWTPAEGTFDPAVVHDQLAARNPHAYSYYFGQVPGLFNINSLFSTPSAEPSTPAALVGASPELVLRATPTEEEITFTTMPLAGSLPQSQAEHMSEAEIKNSLFTEKNLDEHQFVISDIAAILQSIGAQFTLPETPSIVATPRVLHLGTRISGTAPGISMGDFLYKLHPTPAVSGYPQAEAAEFLARSKVFDRGLFSGLVGWIDNRQDSTEGCEFAMTLRGGLVSPSRAVAFAGAGIVADSNPHEELLETRAKLATFAAALGCQEPQPENK
ncbi:MAG: chorismate-binding protein [Corynebacterium sp.]|nr:chorismate-binding protein [Corynebacterium sp.]